MPGTVRPVADERDGLLAFLAQQRDALRLAVHGLTNAQARATPSASAISLGGLIKHATFVEHGWIVGTMMQRPPRTDYGDWAANWRLAADETLASALQRYAEVARETEQIVAELDDLGMPVPVPRDAPWFPKDVEHWSARWVLLHLIEETARHAGHADIIRESLDGKTFYELMAAAEGWDPSAWTGSD